MNASLTLVVIMVVLYSVGVYLLLERSMTRVLLGFLLVGNATNLLILIVGALRSCSVLRRRGCHSRSAAAGVHPDRHRDYFRSLRIPARSYLPVVAPSQR